MTDKYIQFVFLSVFDYPSRYAHAIHGLFMSRAFAGILGHRFLFLVNEVRDDKELKGIRYQRLFGVHGRRIKKLHLRTILMPIAFVFHLTRYGIIGRKDVHVFVNDPRLFRIAVFFERLCGYRVISEWHRLPNRSERANIARSSGPIIALTEAIADEIRGISPRVQYRVRVVPNAVAVEQFDMVSDVSAAKFRENLGFPSGAFVLGYIGRFAPMGEDKGVALLCEAVKCAPHDVRGLFVGGTKDEVADYRILAERLGISSRVVILQHVDPGEVPVYAKACDALAYVPSATSTFFTKETSPMKLFEYMAARRAIIVSDLPTTRSILDDQEAYFTSGYSATAIVQTVAEIRNNPDAARDRVARAYETVRGNTWSARAERILQFT